jgi:hypothetical protein
MNNDKSRWKPIETAPMDGTVIDVWVWSFELVSRDSDELRLSAGMRVADVHCHGSEWHNEENRNLHEALRWFSDVIIVAHWMPKPEAPKVTKDVVNAWAKALMAKHVM